VYGLLPPSENSIAVNNNNNKLLLNIKLCFYLVYNFCLKQTYHSKRNEQDTTINGYWSPYEVRVTFVRFHRRLNFDTFAKIVQVSNFMKLRPVGAELFFGDG